MSTIDFAVYVIAILFSACVSSVILVLGYDLIMGILKSWVARPVSEQQTQPTEHTTLLRQESLGEQHESESLAYHLISSDRLLHELIGMGYEAVVEGRGGPLRGHSQPYLPLILDRDVGKETVVFIAPLEGSKRSTTLAASRDYKEAERDSRRPEKRPLVGSKA